MQGYIVSLHLV